MVRASPLGDRLSRDRRLLAKVAIWRQYLRHRPIEVDQTRNCAVPGSDSGMSAHWGPEPGTTSKDSTKKIQAPRASLRNADMLYFKLTPLQVEVIPPGQCEGAGVGADPGGFAIAGIDSLNAIA
jgi:hypothetical protein